MIDFALLLRAVGFEHVNTLRRNWHRGRDAPELPKVVLSRGYWPAFSRNVVHLLPIAVLITLVCLNWTGYFIGPTFVENPSDDEIYLVGLQLCAKLVELLCVASLAAIVFHALRRELFGNGIPIGLLGSGFYFSSLSAFWSPEFLGAFSWSFTSWRTRALYALLLLCGLVATTIGPATAVLIIPRFQAAPAGGVSFFVNGTADEVWPSIVTADLVPDVCRSGNASSYVFCPSAGISVWSDIADAFAYNGFCPAVGEGYAPKCQAIGAEGFRNWWNFLFPNGVPIVPFVVNSLRKSAWYDAGSEAAQPHLASTISAEVLVKEWMAAVVGLDSINNHQYKWTYDLQTRITTMSPVVRTLCLGPQNLSADAVEAEFNYLEPNLGPFPSWGVGGRNASIAGLDRNETAQMRTQWVSLLTGIFGVPSQGFNISGLLIEWPWAYGYRAAVTCAVLAVWQDSTASATRSVTYDAWNVLPNTLPGSSTHSSPDFSGPSRPLAMEPSWLELLTPTLPIKVSSEPDQRPSNTLETLLVQSSFVNVLSDVREGLCGSPSLDDATLTDAEIWQNCSSLGINPFLQTIVAGIVADGLSRYGSQRVINFSTEDVRSWTIYNPEVFNRSRVFANPAGLTLPFWISTGSNLTGPLASAWLGVEVVGYGFSIMSSSDYLSFAIVCVYLFIVVTYLVITCLAWKKWPPTSSAAWESITELLTLCQNSPPSKTSQKLKNTSGGIEHLRTYQALVKIRAFPTASDEGASKLHLVLDDDSWGELMTPSHHLTTEHPYSAVPQSQAFDAESHGDADSHRLISMSSSHSIPLLRSSLRQRGVELIRPNDEYS